jgi:hypothetical protein
MQEKCFLQYQGLGVLMQSFFVFVFKALAAGARRGLSP